MGYRRISNQSFQIILSQGDPTHVVTFAYGYGAGTVIYSSIPLDFYRDFLNNSNETLIVSRPGIETLRPYSDTNTVGWDMDISDQFRAGRFIEELKAFEAKGEFPQLVMICLPDDHTSGTDPGAPTHRAGCPRPR